MKKADMEMVTLCHQETEKIILFYEERIEALTEQVKTNVLESGILAEQNKELRRSLAAILSKLYEATAQS